MNEKYDRSFRAPTRPEPEYRNRDESGSRHWRSGGSDENVGSLSYGPEGTGARDMTPRGWETPREARGGEGFGQRGYAMGPYDRRDERDAPARDIDGRDFDRDTWRAGPVDARSRARSIADFGAYDYERDNRAKAHPGEANVWDRTDGGRPYRGHGAQRGTYVGPYDDRPHGRFGYDAAPRGTYADEHDGRPAFAEGIRPRSVQEQDAYLRSQEATTSQADRDRGNYRAQGTEGRGNVGPAHAIPSRFRAPKGYTRSDERIREDVCDTLGRISGVDPSDVEVTVRDGEVTLAGTVARRWEKHELENRADLVSGVKEVHNTIRVKRENDAHKAPSDAATRAPATHENGSKRAPTSSSSS